MNEKVKDKLRRLPRENLDWRFRELREKLGNANPQSIAGGREPLENTLEDHEEYQFLAEMLGYKAES